MNKVRIIAAVVAFAGLLYCGWSLNRMGAAVMLDSDWPLPFPYPDTLLDQYHAWLDARYPASTGTLKLHGEIFRVRLTLWAICGAFTTVLIVAVRPALRRPKSQGAAPNGGAAALVDDSNAPGGSSSVITPKKV